MSSPAHKEKIWNLISKIKTGMLCTYEGGEMNSRPMHLVQDDYDGTVWFYTNVDSQKVEDDKEHEDVCLSFSDPRNNTYVSLTGKAKLTQDPELIEKFWSPFVAAWFPEGKDAPSCGLLEIKINHGEHWDSERSSVGYLYQVAKANLTNKTPDAGQHEKF